MGLIKWILKKCQCKSKCTFNVEDFDDIAKVDLSQYILKKSDMIFISKLVKKRPSIHTYLHTLPNGETTYI